MFPLRMNRIFIAILAVALGVGGAYFSPYLALRSMESAAASGDVDRLAAYVNYPELRVNLQARLDAELVQSTPKRGRKGAIGEELTDAVVDQKVEALTMPESLAMMMQGNPPGVASAGTAEVDAALSYDGPNRFVMRVKRHEVDAAPIILILHRDGLFRWKLSDLHPAS